MTPLKQKHGKIVNVTINTSKTAHAKEFLERLASASIRNYCIPTIRPFLVLDDESKLHGISRPVRTLQHNRIHPDILVLRETVG